MEEGSLAATFFCLPVCFYTARHACVIIFFLNHEPIDFAREISARLF